MKIYKILGWNYLANAAGYLDEEYESLAAAEQGVKNNLWIMDDYIIQEIVIDHSREAIKKAGGL